MLAVRLNVTTDESGNGEATQTPKAGGYSYLLFAVEWIDGDYADGVDAVLSCVNSVSGVDRTLLTLTDANNDKVYYPRHLEQDEVGGNLTSRALPVVSGDLKLAIAQGGNAKTGGCVVYLVEVA
jgi:hypothetical protein